MRALITGATGFAGSHLARACAAAGDSVLALSRAGDPVPGEPDVEPVAADLRDGERFAAVLRETRPEVVYHLAALSSVGRSWHAPGATVTENTATAVNVLEAVRHHAPLARLIWVSSCEVYGIPRALPIDEAHPLAPANPYAVSKAAGDMLAALYAEAHGLDIVRARPFSHSGPGQRPIFLLSSLARQAADARRAGASRVRILTGNPDTRRDFTDVRDTVRAYRLLAERAPAGVYNVASSRSISAGEQVSLVAELLAPVEVEHGVDPARVRAHEVMDLRGSCARLQAATGWEREIPFVQTMTDTIAWWERELSSPHPAGRGA